jgi:hypothetical protein
MSTAVGNRVCMLTVTVVQKFLPTSSALLSVFDLIYISVYNAVSTVTMHKSIPYCIVWYLPIAFGDSVSQFFHRFSTKSDPKRNVQVVGW